MSVDDTPGFERTTFSRSLDFYTSRVWLLDGRDADGKPALTLIDKPDDANLALLARPRADRAALRLDARRHDLAARLAAGRRRRRLPARRAPLRGAVHADGHALAGRLRHRRGRKRAAQRAGRRRRPHRGGDAHAPTAGSTAPSTRPSPARCRPSELHDPHARRRPAGRGLLPQLHRLPHARLAVPRARRQRRARAAEGAPARSSTRRACASSRSSRRPSDGTRVPYFVIWPKGATHDGAQPDAAVRLRRLRDLADARLLGRHRQGLARARRRAGSTPTSAAAASTGRPGTRRRVARAQAAQLRRLHRRRRGPGRDAG